VRTSNEYDLSPLVERLKPIVANMEEAEKDPFLARFMQQTFDRPRPFGLQSAVI